MDVVTLDEPIRRPELVDGSITELTNLIVINKAMISPGDDFNRVAGTLENVVAQNGILASDPHIILTAIADDEMFDNGVNMVNDDDRIEAGAINDDRFAEIAGQDKEMPFVLATENDQTKGATNDIETLAQDDFSAARGR